MVPQPCGGGGGAADLLVRPVARGDRGCAGISVVSQFVRVDQFVPRVIAVSHDAAGIVGATGSLDHVREGHERFKQHKESSKNSNALTSYACRRHEMCTHSRTSAAR